MKLEESLCPIICYIAIVINIVRYWQRDRHTDQWSRRDNQEQAPHKCGQLIFEKVAKAIQRRKETL